MNYKKMANRIGVSESLMRLAGKMHSYPPHIKDKFGPLIIEGKIGLGKAVKLAEAEYREWIKSN